MWLYPVTKAWLWQDVFSCHAFWNDLSTACDGSEQEAKSLPVRCQRCLPEWNTYLTNLHGATNWFWWWFWTCLLADQVHLWSKASWMSLEYWIWLCNLKAWFLPAYFRSLHLHLVAGWLVHHCHCLGGWLIVICDTGMPNWADKGKFGSWMGTYRFGQASKDHGDRDCVTWSLHHNLPTALPRIHLVKGTDG